ncbi:MAG: H/ACA ribonucleoprotein complex subunit GAR1 [Thermoplasmata archaeon]|jgi:rRNA processing protein Gar1
MSELAIKVGKVIAIRGNMLIAKSFKVPNVGDEVYDSNGKLVGRIINIFGPVNSPYFRVRIEKGKEVKGYLFTKGDKDGGGRKEGKKGHKELDRRD